MPVSYTHLLPGQNIDGVDIRVYECNSQTNGGLIDGEVAPGIGYMIDGGWEDMGCLLYTSRHKPMVPAESMLIKS